jgi:UDP-N-acetylmuramoyl-L-alanyl-D-glutamate--2,6-diaminopimelate ligase
MMKIPLSVLSAALPGSKLSACPDSWVTGLCANSKDVQPGDLFACIRGAHSDSHGFIPEAVQRGAAAVLVDRAVDTGKYPGVGVVRVPNVVQALMQLAPAFYNLPTLRMRMVGVTGTNGKTTITHLIRSIVEHTPAERGADKRRVGVVGTIRHEIAGRVLVSHNTTPMAWDLQKLLRDMADAHCDTAVLEVSSHALDQNRIAGCEFDVAVFTNLTQDHLDYHKTMAAYARAKQRLFSGLAQAGWKKGLKFAVVNGDDPQGVRMARAARGAKVLTYGVKASAQVRASDVRSTPGGNEFKLITPKGSIAVRLPLLGQYNVYNALAAAGAGLALGASLPQIKRGLEAVTSVPGRLEKIAGNQPFAVVVDFAHTPDALEKALLNVREWTKGRVLLVFGCGGDRDAGKRPMMGALGARLADRVVITSDNPRSEDPLEIMAQIQAGCLRVGKKAHAEPARARAIRWALQQARPGDTVLLAGKGHETYQILKDRVVEFDDRKVARKELSKLGYTIKSARK